MIGLMEPPYDRSNAASNGKMSILEFRTTLFLGYFLTFFHLFFKADSNHLHQDLDICKLYS